MWTDSTWDRVHKEFGHMILIHVGVTTSGPTDFVSKVYDELNIAIPYWWKDSE